MVCDRRVSRATILERGFSTSPVNHPVSVPPKSYVHRDAFWCGQCTRWQVLCVQTGSFSCLQFTTLRRLCGQLLRQPLKKPAPRGVACPLFLGSKKHRVVNIVTDAWLATAGLQGGQTLEASSSTCSASHPLLPSASAAPQGPEVRDGPCHVLGLRFVVPRLCGVPVASCCGSGKSSDGSSLLTVAAAA